MNNNFKNISTSSAPFEAMRAVVHKLLGPSGCPWDRAQTPQSLCDNICEEVFELCDAIRQSDDGGICEELGDVLFLAVLIAELNKQAGGAGLDEALQNGAKKMIRRHPHVFGDAKVNTKDELVANWEQIKREEKAAKQVEAGALDSIAAGLPPLLKAYRIHSRAARTGFTWDSACDVEAQFEEEWKEWHDAINSNDSLEMAREFGDLLFTLVELGRRYGIKANSALDMTNIKFISRFKKMEALAQQEGRDFLPLTLEEKNMLWNRVKAEDER